MDIRNKEDDVSGANNFIGEFLKSFLYLSGSLRTGSNQPQIKFHDSTIKQLFGNIVLDDIEGKVLNYGIATNILIADEKGIITTIAGQNRQHLPVRFFVSNQ